jgi:two-component system chemotaxis sensor kinase CheA
VIELHESELAEVIGSIERRTPHEQLAAQVRELGYEPVQRRFVRLAERAKGLANRLGKSDLTVVQDGGSVRLPAEGWNEFWGSFVHLIRNAVDHGIETRAERDAAGKKGPAQLRLSCRLVGAECIVEISDNGRGIAWERVQAKAQQFGLPHATRDDLTNALFTDGLSTRDEASETSGRGVGMGAVREACLALGGRIEVLSEAGQGTTFRFTIPYRSAAAAARKVA